MEFEDLKMIWDQQNEAPMYAIDQKALHRRIMKKLNRTQALANLNEIGLVLIFAATAVVLIGFRSDSIFNYTIAGALVVIGGLILRSRHRRKQRENQFDHTLLGDLDHAIEQADYLVKMSNSFTWFLLPVAIPAVLNMWFSDNPINPTQWALVLGAFLLSVVLVRWELRRKHIPRKKELEALRETLMEQNN